MRTGEKEAQQEPTEDWIAHIARKTIENYNGREIVIWGKGGAADSIKHRLKARYGKEIAFYIDSDSHKADGKQVFLPDYISGKSEKYYVVVPLACNPSIRENLLGGGIFPM